MMKKRSVTKRHDGQTSFASGSLLYEPISRPEPAQTELTKQPASPWKSVLLGVGILLVVLAAIVAYALYRQPNNGHLPVFQTEEEELPAQDLSTFKKRLSELETDLEQADPGQENMPFPPVDLELNFFED